MNKLLRILFLPFGCYTVYKNMNFIHLLLSNFFTVILQFRTSIHFKIIKIFSVEAEMLLWFNVLFLALLQLWIISRCKDSWHHVIKPMYKIAVVIFRHLIALPQRTWPLPQYRSGGTPLIQLSIEKHAKPTLRDYNFTPHVTIFWKFCWQKSHN